MFCGIIQRGPQFFNSRIEVVIEFNERAFGPEPAPKVLASYDSSLRLYQNKQEVKGLVLQPYTHSALQQLPCAGIGFEDSESVYGRGLSHGCQFCP